MERLSELLLLIEISHDGLHVDGWGELARRIGRCALIPGLVGVFVPRASHGVNVVGSRQTGDKGTALQCDLYESRLFHLSRNRAG
jgi:hypothetical protein